MNPLIENWKSNTLLLLMSAIWGFAFVAQKAGMEHMGPYTFNAARFCLGSLSLVPVILIFNRMNKAKESPESGELKALVLGGLTTGLALFLASSFQQVGLLYTSAGKAGFLTGFYLIIVPIIGFFWKQKIHQGIWFGSLMAIVGLYFLSIKDDFSIGQGDLLVLVSAVLWAFHIQLVGYFAPRTVALHLAFVQFFFCSVLCVLVALVKESIQLASFYEAIVPIAYAGIISVGVAYTIQVVAQKKVHPAHAAIIMSFEAVFALIGGCLLLQETISFRGLAGCSLMLAGMLFSQLYKGKSIS